MLYLFIVQTVRLFMPQFFHLQCGPEQIMTLMTNAAFPPSLIHL